MPFFIINNSIQFTLERGFKGRVYTRFRGINLRTTKLFRDDILKTKWSSCPNPPGETIYSENDQWSYCILETNSSDDTTCYIRPEYEPQPCSTNHDANNIFTNPQQTLLVSLPDFEMTQWVLNDGNNNFIDIIIVLEDDGGGGGNGND